MRYSSVTFNLLASSALLALCSASAQAQTIYRIIGADGKVTFSDKPPADASKATASTAAGKQLGAADEGLPYELRQIVARYPVTLYAGAACPPCNSGRQLLQSRGVPYTEHTISTPEDAEALQRISGSNSLPFVMIGGQRIKGYSEAEWSQFLNAANYPQTSMLSASYRNPPPKPLVTAQKPPAKQGDDDAPAKGEEKSAENRPAPVPAIAAPPNPGGIKF